MLKYFQDGRVVWQMDDDSIKFYLKEDEKYLFMKEFKH